MSRNLKLFFTISVLINILLVGTLAGFLFRCNYAGGPNAAEMTKLSPEGKALMAESFQKSHDQMGDIFTDARAARNNVIAILQADTFDKKAFDAASDKLRKLQTRIMQRRADTAAELSEKLNPADRKLLAEWLAGPGGRSPSKYFPHKGKDDGKGAADATGKTPASDTAQKPEN